MGWLPKGAETPKQNSSYLKLIEGEIKFRIVSEPVYGYEYWTNEKKPVRLHEMPQGKPADIRVEKDSSYSIKHFWAFKVLDREDGKVKIFEITQNGVKGQIEGLLQDADWGDPTAYDIKIKGEGTGLERRYSVTPCPSKPLTAEEKSIVARTEIDLDKLFESKDPFSAEPKSEVNVGDVPF
jgi:hypothetical protein